MSFEWGLPVATGAYRYKYSLRQQAFSDRLEQSICRVTFLDEHSQIPDAQDRAFLPHAGPHRNESALGIHLCTFFPRCSSVCVNPSESVSR